MIHLAYRRTQKAFFYSLCIGLWIVLSDGFSCKQFRETRYDTLLPVVGLDLSNQVVQAIDVSGDDIPSGLSSNIALSEEFPNNGKVLRNRRDWIRRALVLTTSALVGTSTSSSASAYVKTFPLELNAIDGSEDRRNQKITQLMNRRNSRKSISSSTAANVPSPRGAVLWGAASWLLMGSRSNPLVTPLANVLYDEQEEAWLKDRNEGLFANVPAPLLLVVAIVFLIIGIGADTVVTRLADMNHATSVQLACVSLIGGVTLELGRIATGEKNLSRVESARESLLNAEFLAFARDRLKLGGNCHRVDVVRAFRRYYSKYRQIESPDFPLSDREIEQLLRKWSRQFTDAEMSSTGFYSGIQINQDADVFTASSR